MNIGVTGRHKLNEIIDSDVNTNFDQVCQDIVRLANALNAYQIDLGADVKGTLPGSRLAVASPTLLAFLRDDGTFQIPPSVDNLQRTAFQQTRDNATTADQFPTTYFGVPSGAAAVDAETTGAFVEYTSGAVAGNTAGWTGNNTFCIGSNFPIFEIRLKTGASISNVRFWLGINAAGTAPNTDTSNNAIAFRYSSATDAGWVGVCNDNGAQSVSSQIAAIAASTVYRLKFQVVSSSLVQFQVNGGTVQTIVTNMPATRHMTFVAQVVTTDAVAKKVSLQRLFCLAG